MNVRIESETEATEADLEGQPPEEDTSSEDPQELKITVRKLEVPVRPRGVLAE
jgi:hypothetical protein